MYLDMVCWPITANNVANKLYALLCICKKKKNGLPDDRKANKTQEYERIF